MAVNQSATKRIRVEYTQQFAQMLQALVDSQQRLDDNQKALEELVKDFLMNEKKIIQARNRFVTIGIALSLLVSCASLVIAIFLH